MSDPIDPIVTKTVDADGVEHWAAASSPSDAAAGTADTDHEPDSESEPTAEEVTDAPTTDADGDRPDTGKRKR